ncbi:spore germination protein [Paenibacillus phyllosphaerae]|uniref:Spore germination protein n=1 Tax=Paenibacillus phyllosphaerae TaxID=274593 RepID=A0A7W5FQI7_9BACL|nr:endospore germination permease [Paenibacillus phyllosphaerae]MBB3113292.1 spore germination protein [Paenibacillus phyllosphaerae]
MSRRQYDDNRISAPEMTITVTSMIIGVGILTLPRVLAGTTESSDGWISIALAGCFGMLLAFILGKYGVLLGNETFYDFIGKLITKPIAAGLMIVVMFYYAMYASYEVRAIANISKTYLFERTPSEAIGLTFLLIVCYAVSGSRIGIIRLNTLFLPFVVVLTMVVLFLSNTIIVWQELKPVFVTKPGPLLTGAQESGFTMLGFESILFYSTMMKRPKDAPKAAVFGVAIPVVLYMGIYLACVGIFSQAGLQEIGYPAIELAKEVKIPGEFFERMESVFFTIWIMTIFNSCTMAFDMAMHAGYSVFKKGKRIHWVILLAPIIYYIGMMPKNVIAFAKYGSFISYIGYGLIILLAILYPFAKRKVKRSWASGSTGGNA